MDLHTSFPYTLLSLLERLQLERQLELDCFHTFLQLPSHWDRL